MLKNGRVWALFSAALSEYKEEVEESDV